MLAFEIVFFGIFSFAILRMIFRPASRTDSYSNIALTTFIWIVVAILFQGWRWQMYPATLGFILLVLFSHNKPVSKTTWRVAGAIPLVLLLCTSIFLSQQVPVVAMPAPNGPHAVGNTDFTLTDSTRSERWAPERNRELYIEVWYPAAREGIDAFPVRTLHQELYEGSYDIWSFLLGYLKNIPTSSHRNAPLATAANETFPVLLFNHGADGYTSQNQILMEHLASNGYVILSIAHPYQSLKVNLPSAGTVTLTSDLPQDTGFDIRNMERGLGSKIRRELNSSALEYSPMRALILELVDNYAAAETEDDKELIVENALKLDAFKPYLHLMTSDSLGEYLRYVYGYQHRQIEYWVEDTQFVADKIAEVDTVVDGLSEAFSTTEFGVIGMSFGGAAAGEFCKIDKRCKAGVNLDGTQFGRHWNLPLITPFLMFYSEEHQGGNDYAYMPPRNDYREYTVKQSTHVDFLDLSYTHPILKTLGAGGEIEGERMMEILKVVNLDFFDEFLKGKPTNNGVYDDIPELLVRDNIDISDEGIDVY